MADFVEKVEEVQLNCPICFEIYSDPKQLQCHHVFCKKCLVSLVIKDQQDQLVLPCPKCRHITPVPASGVSGLQVAFRTNQLLELVKQHKNKPPSSGCPEHDEKEKELCCETCGEIVCWKCTMRGEKHYNHEYLELNAITSLLEPVEKKLMIISEALKQLNASKEHQQEANEIAAKSNIEDKKGQLRKTLDGRKTELAKQQKDLETTQEELRSIKKNLETGIEGVEELMKRTSFEQLIKLIDSVQPDLLKPATEANIQGFSADFHIKDDEFSHTKSSHKRDTERRHIVYQKVIEAKHLVEICFLVFNYMGLPRSGKTSFRRRIMREIINILQACEIEQPSTGLAEDGGQVMFSKTGMGAIASKVWTVLREGDEATILRQLLDQVATLPPSTNNSTDDTVNQETPTNLINSDPLVASDHAELLGGESKLSTTSMTSGDANSTALTTDIMKEDEEMLSILSDALESDNLEKVKFILEDLTIITSNDAGGHAEFLDLHAALIHGPSFNLFFSRLPDELDEVFEISYTNKKGESSSEGNSTLTVEEVLFQALASVACFGCPYSMVQPEDIVSEKCKELSGDTTSKVMFVCTHLDKIEDEEERNQAFNRKDELLRNKIETTEFYQKDIIKYVSENQLMIKANNYNGDEEEIKNIQDILMEVISRSFNQKIKIPPSWLILSLYLRKFFSIVGLKECQEIASKLRINSEDLQDALWFLHHCVGALLYYPEVEAMRDIVICKRQVIFDSASKLIRDTFTVNKVGHQRCMEFREKGQFFQNDLEKAMREAAKEAESDSLIPLDKLVSLFKHRNILTPITDSPSPRYFMPCVLHSASKDMLKFCQGKTDPPSLMLCYNCGYMPLGIFPAIITNLVSQQREDWIMNEGDLYKNKVQFRVGSDLDVVTLMAHPRYFEIAITRDEQFEVSTSTLCAEVRSIILSTLDTVISNMNYHFNMKYKLAFECLRHPEREHLCVVANGCKKMLCQENPKWPKPLLLQDYHKVWLPSVNMQAPNSTALEKKDSATIHRYLENLKTEELILLGQTLGLNRLTLQKYGPQSLADELISDWLRGDYHVLDQTGQPSWQSLAKALKDIELTGVSLSIQQDFKICL